MQQIIVPAAGCGPGINLEIRAGRECSRPGSPWSAALQSLRDRSQSHDPAWLAVLQESLGHRPYVLQATVEGRVEGVLPLALVRSFLFGRFLVSLPYLNSAGVLASDARIAAALVDQAVQLAARLRVRYLELRHETALPHAALQEQRTSKVHMRLELPSSADSLWKFLPAKVRNQVRKGEKQQFQTVWGRGELLGDFYAVFSRNMRDLGTPVYSKRLFDEILRRFPQSSELCVVRDGRLPVAGALLIHGQGRTEVPSAGSLRSYNSTCVNMQMYWQLLARAVERGQSVFDFGRSTFDGPTYHFKKQWRSQAEAAVWQYHVRRGSVGDMRPDNPSYSRMIRIWRRLPVAVTRVIGPAIVRGIP